ncbi:MAG: hypothetical protein P8Y45_19070 [Exilibacterium sp.]
MKRKIISICLLAVIHSAYIYVAYLAFTPNVATNYRLYYIERKLKYWNHGSGINYTLGEPIYFSKAVPYLSRRDWTMPEKDGIWSKGKLSELYFEIDKDSMPKSISITGKPFLSPENGIKSQKVTFFINDIFLDSHTFTKEQQLLLTIPTEKLIDVNR